MAAPRANASLYRVLLRELRQVYKQKSETPAQTFVKEQFRKFQATGEQICRGPNDMQHLGETYACLLQSNRKYEALHAEYKGQEKDVETSANLVGLKLPKVYNASSSPKSE